MLPSRGKVDTMASITKKSQFIGTGCLIQILGLLLLFVFPIGTIIGILLLITGSRLKVKLVCSECGNKIDGKEVKLCPTCKADFSTTSEIAELEPDNIDKIIDV